MENEKADDHVLEEAVEGRGAEGSCSCCVCYRDNLVDDPYLCPWKQVEEVAEASVLSSSNLRLILVLCEFYLLLSSLTYHAPFSLPPILPFVPAFFAAPPPSVFPSLRVPAAVLICFPLASRDQMPRPLYSYFSSQVPEPYDPIQPFWPPRLHVCQTA